VSDFTIEKKKKNEKANQNKNKILVSRSREPTARINVVGKAKGCIGSYTLSIDTWPTPLKRVSRRLQVSLSGYLLEFT
jgi:hypothetical protein